MNKRKKRLIIFGLLLLSSIVVVAIGLKYFPFTRVVRMPAVSEQALAGTVKTSALAPHTLYFDFEVAPGKEMPDGFYKGQAHSGQYSVKAFGQNSFSAVVERTAGEVGVENLKAVALSAWIYVFPTKNDVKGSLVFTASSEVGVNVCWHGVTVAEPDVPKGSWFKISGYFDLSGVAFKPGYKLQVYFWNNSSTDILADDYFISFGGAVDRRGDSARVDMTRPGGFVPAFNMPPFPVTYLEREPLQHAPDPAGFGSGAVFAAGDFLKTGADQLLVLDGEGKAWVHAYCADSREFERIAAGNAIALAPAIPAETILTGRFIPSGHDQFIVAGKTVWLLAAVDAKGDACSGNNAMQPGIRVIKTMELDGHTLYAGDFNGDRRSEVLAVSSNGSWKVLSFDPGGSGGGSWKILATGDGSLMPEWNRAEKETGISVGRFQPGTAADLVLTVTRDKGQGTSAWSLRRLDIPGNEWKSVMSQKPDGFGRTIGFDTLRPQDRFLSLTDNAGRTTLLRYSREWRFDLKEIRFSDTSFTILSTVDFNGYEKDRNPKYYESLALISGNFLKSRERALFVIGRVDPGRGYRSVLPDFTDLYTQPVKPRNP